MITVKEAQTRKELKKFILFPFELYKNDKNWVPPLIVNEWKIFDSRKNPAFDHCEAAYFLAYKDNHLVGRIAAIINHKANVHWNEKKTRFGWIAFIDDPEVSKALLDAAEAWGKAKGMKGIHGPLGFSDLDPEGVMVEGFGNEPSVTTAYNYPYFAQHLESHGFKKVTDWIQFRLNAFQEIPEKPVLADDGVAAQYKVEAFFPANKKELQSYAPGIFKAMNAAFRNLYGFVELSDRQIEFYIKAYLRFARPELICILIDESNNVIGFGVCFPSLSKAFRKARGKLFPFGFIHILKALRKYNEADLYFAGVHPDWQKRGLHALCFNRLKENFKKHNIQLAISTGQPETNINAVSIWDNYEREPYFRTRCFIRE